MKPSSVEQWAWDRAALLCEATCADFAWDNERTGTARLYNSCKLIALALMEVKTEMQLFYASDLNKARYAYSAAIAEATRKGPE